MKIIVCGIGRCSVSVIESLYNKGYDVIVIDDNRDLIEQINNRFDVKVCCEPILSIDALENIGIQNSDLVISLTANDLVNMMVCRLYKQIFHVKKSIAFIENADYFKIEYRNIYDIDYMVSPEFEVVNFIDKEVISIFFRVVVIKVSRFLNMFLLTANENIDSSDLEKWCIDNHIVFLGVVRNNEFIEIPQLKKKIKKEDQLIILSTNIKSFIDVARYFYKINITKDYNIVVLSDGNVIANAILKSTLSNFVKITIIDSNIKNAELLANNFPNQIIGGDTTDQVILKEGGIQSSDLVIAVTCDDYKNIFSALIANQLHSQRSIVLLNNNELTNFTRSLGVNVVVSYNNIIIKKIFEFIDMGLAMNFCNFFLGKDIKIAFVEITSNEVIDKMELIMNDIEILVIYRNNKVLLLTDDITLQINDNLLIYLQNS